MTFLILSIGPFLAIPRTAVTTYEIGIRPFFPAIHPIIIIIVYFIINLILVLNPTTIVDVIGSILTPILLLVLIILIIKGIVIPTGPFTEDSVSGVFSMGLIEGYQTMDAIGAVCFGSIIVSNIKEKGYTQPRAIIGMTLKSSLIAVVGLGIIYGGLMYLGTRTGNIIGNIEKTQLISSLAEQILGKVGSVLLAYQLPIYVTLIIVLIEEGSKLIGTNLLGFLPLSGYGFGWSIPAIIAYIIVKCIPHQKEA